MITLDVAAASAAFEAKVITDLRDETAKAMASANGDIDVHLGGADTANDVAMRDMGARQHASAGPSRAMNNEKRSWDDRNEGSYSSRKKRSY
ncbi:hypothetical protein BHYA_0015g00530 [Botrytis hyacinthi]|uniref:Uncharacterized protein n=1 Tax=Botrytis hyacinthi TaxID=278943 RepID=A0A4Z1H4E1_9HELO|nr:hypothetical protein BHYA_0015g00530 [Botrytis hyacinthi]